MKSPINLCNYFFIILLYKTCFLFLQLACLSKIIFYNELTQLF